MTDAHPLAPRVREVVGQAFPGAGVLSIKALEGGHSGQTLLVELRDAPVAHAVAKSGALGRPSVGRHDVLRQARLLAAIDSSPGVHVPAVLAFGEGVPAMFLMSFEPGDATEPVLDGEGRMDPQMVADRALAAARMLAALGQVDLPRAGLGDEPVMSIEDELTRWSETMSVVDQSLVEGADEVREMLAATVPPPLDPTVVHGDYRLGNIIFDGVRPSGIIDWEIWSITDPRIDLGWFLISCDHGDFPSVGEVAPGMPGLADLVAEYAAAGGSDQDVPWFVAFSRFKMAAIMAHNLRRHREGRHHDPFQERLPPTIESLIRRARGALEAEGTPSA